MNPEPPASEPLPTAELVLHSTARAKLWLAPQLLGESADSWLRQGEDRLWECAAEAGDRVLGTGRAPARAVTIGGRNGVWRRNRHGGLLGDLQGDRYRSARRLADEISLSRQLRELGVATPQVLLALAQRRTGFWRQNLVTEEVVDAQTVFAARDSAAALDSAADLLEQTFAVGLWATDLHPDNMLWQPDDSHAAGGRCWVIDLAGARLMGRPLNSEEAQARRSRFARYFQKHAGEVPERFRID